MKQNRKGFTLIELLAVIVILAIIALIATPIILNMINEARKSSAKSSSLGFIDSIEYYAGFSEANAAGGIGVSGYDVYIPGAVTCVTHDGSTWTGGPAYNTIDTNSSNTADACDVFMDAVATKSKGKTPDDASIVLDANGKVQNNSTLKFNGYTCKYDGTDIPDTTGYGCHK